MCTVPSTFFILALKYTTSVSVLLLAFTHRKSLLATLHKRDQGTRCWRGLLALQHRWRLDYLKFVLVLLQALGGAGPPLSYLRRSRFLAARLRLPWPRLLRGWSPLCLSWRSSPFVLLQGSSTRGFGQGVTRRSRGVRRSGRGLASGWGWRTA